MSGKATLPKVVQWAIVLPVGAVGLYASAKAGYWVGQQIKAWRMEKRRPELEAKRAKLREEMRRDIERTVAVCRKIAEVKIQRKQRLIKKEIEPIIFKDDLKNGPTTEATCPSCNYGKAAFQQLQTRSADEPMTTFYCCLNESCGRQWRED